MSSVVQQGSLAATEPSETWSSRLRRRLSSEHFALVVVLVLLCVTFTVTSPYFLAYGTFVNVLNNAVIAGIIAVPATMLMISAQIDLSVGSGVAVCGVVMARVATGVDLQVGIAVTIALGLLIGAINGFIVTVIGVNSLITTLGMLAILSGAAQLVSGGQTVLLQGFSWLGQSRPFANIPLSVLILLAVLLGGGFVLRYTVYGRQQYAIGGNPLAARLVGIRSGWVVFSLFVLSGLAVAVSALIQTSQLGAGSANSAIGLELSVVTAVVLGGTSLTGGRGTIIGTVLGLLIIGVLNTGLILLNVDPYWQNVARGALLIVAVSFDRIRVRMAARQTRRAQEERTAGLSQATEQGSATV